MNTPNKTSYFPQTVYNGNILSEWEKEYEIEIEGINYLAFTKNINISVKSEELIRDGKVWVNGKKASIGDKVDPKRDDVTVNGKKVTVVKQKYYIMLNKPRGYVTTMSDELGRKCVAELVSDVGATVYPVGRLDRDSEGMLLLTNDGEFANSVMHPRKHISKIYRVTVRSSVSKEQTEQLENGVLIDGRETLPAEVAVLEKTDARSVLQIKIFEGRNRQIRKMCEEVGLEVIRLKTTE